MSMRHLNRRISLVNRTSLLFVALGLCIVAACSGGGPDRTDPPAYPRDRWGRVDSRAEYEAYRQYYSGEKRRMNTQQWEALQRRADAYKAEKRKRDAAAQQRNQHRWMSYQ